MKVVVALIGLLLAAPSCMAMDVQSYKQNRVQERGTSFPENRMAEALLLGYVGGIAETLELQRDPSGRLVFPYRGDESLVACIPPSVRVTHQLLRTVTDAEVDQHADMYAADKDFEKRALPTFIFLGLTRTFPCK